MSPEPGRSSRQRNPPRCTSSRSTRLRLPNALKSKRKASDCCCSLIQKRQTLNCTSQLPAGAYRHSRDGTMLILDMALGTPREEHPVTVHPCRVVRGLSSPRHEDRSQDSPANHLNSYP